MTSVSEKIDLPSEVPLMFLPGVVLLPGTMMPIFIFEPRYREMLAFALEQQRIFGLALVRPGVEEVRGAADFHPICGVGLVRACVGHEDGTSHLVLQGLARVEVGDFTQDSPFRIAEVRELPEPDRSSAEAERLAANVRKLCLQMCPEEAESRARLEEQISSLQEPGSLADIAAHIFLRDPLQQQMVLEELRVEERLQLVLRLLRSEMAG